MKKILKKPFLMLAAISVLLISLFSVLHINNVFAAGPSGSFAATGYNGRACPTFLGLTSWDCGMDSSIDSEDALKKNVWIIAANVANDATIIAAYLVIAYVIYGGYLYTFSGGDTGKVAAGKKTLVHAFLGLAIVLSASLIMSTIRTVLIGNGNRLKDCTVESCVEPGAMVEQLITWFVGVAGIISAVFLVYGGISYMTASGDSGKLQKAKQMILYSLIGLAIVAFSSAMIAFVSGIIKNSQALNTTTNLIAKEVYEK